MEINSVFSEKINKNKLKFGEEMVPGRRMLFNSSPYVGWAQPNTSVRTESMRSCAAKSLIAFPSSSRAHPWSPSIPTNISKNSKHSRESAQ